MADKTLPTASLPITAYAVLGLLTFGDELTGYELKQRADMTLRFYWVSPAMSQVYAELTRLREHGLIEATTRPDGGRDVTTYAITTAGREALETWMSATPAGFPVLKHPVLLRLLIGHVGEREELVAMLEEYVEQLRQATSDLREVRESLRGADEDGEAFFHPLLVAEWGLEYFAAERRQARTALRRLQT